MIEQCAVDGNQSIFINNYEGIFNRIKFIFVYNVINCHYLHSLISLSIIPIPLLNCVGLIYFWMNESLCSDSFSSNAHRRISIFVLIFFHFIFPNFKILILFSLVCALLEDAILKYMGGWMDK